MPATVINGSEATEVDFISGVTSNGTVAAQSFWTWNGDNPATYSSGPTGTGKWASPTAGTPATVSYSFDPAAHWTATEKAGITTALALWSAEVGVTFTAVTSGGQIDFERATDKTATGGAGGTESTIGSTRLGTFSSGTVAIDTSVAGFGPIGASLTDYGGYPWETLEHEIGHAIGLGHAGAYNGDGASPMLTSYDNDEYSIMSYNESTSDRTAERGDNGKYYSASPTTPMMLDILAAQRLYGLPTSTPLSGGQIFGFHTNITGAIKPFFDFTVNTAPVVTLWDAGTGNTLDLSGFFASHVDLHGGALSSIGGMSQNLGIAFGTKIDTVILGDGNNFVTANDDGDTICVGPVADSITCGAGADTIQGTVASFAYDTFYDFSATDRIHVTDADTTLSVSSHGIRVVLGGRSQITESSSTAAPVVGHHYVIASDPKGGIDLFWHAYVKSDFDGDSSSGILWQNSSGAVSTWEVNGTALRENTNYAVAPSGWHVVETLDVNDDGYSDILWRNDNGAVSVWTGSPNGLHQGAINAYAGTEWHIAATGDINDDSKDDIVWQRNDGAVAVWTSNGSGFNTSAYYHAPVGAGWSIEGVAAFTALVGILWRNASGAISVWSGDGQGGFQENTYYDSSMGTQWHVAGLADFNGDGQADILWRNDNGAISVWSGNGTSFLKATYTGFAATGWSVAGTGDYNGDGKADILWHNSDGAISIWTSNGGGFDQNTLYDAGAATSWHVADHTYF